MRFYLHLLLLLFYFCGLLLSLFITLNLGFVILSLLEDFEALVLMKIIVCLFVIIKCLLGSAQWLRKPSKYWLKIKTKP